MDPSQRKDVHSTGQRNLTVKCAESINNNPKLQQLFRSTDDNTRRTILSAWREGYIASHPEENVIGEQAFLSESLSEVREAVAA